jgi:hypothetical protein
LNGDHGFIFGGLKRFVASGQRHQTASFAKRRSVHLDWVMNAALLSASNCSVFIRFILRPSWH